MEADLAKLGAWSTEFKAADAMIEEDQHRRSSPSQKDDKKKSKRSSHSKKMSSSSAETARRAGKQQKQENRVDGSFSDLGENDKRSGSNGKMEKASMQNHLLEMEQFVTAVKNDAQAKTQLRKSYVAAR